ncbi:MAG: hypothetical protein HFJ50_01570 [Clostridia bacterium]|jgi:alpha-tubulin suppressor-like RCC1 family protein|nr:hypothetical protein [Clostridia bacterium]
MARFIVFGFNENGECGRGDYKQKSTITKVQNITDVIDVSAGKNHTNILRSTGEVLVTGSNMFGELRTK